MSPRDSLSLAVVVGVLTVAAGLGYLLVMRVRKPQASQRRKVGDFLLGATAGWMFLATIFGGTSVMVIHPEITSAEAATTFGFTSEKEYSLVPWGEVPETATSWFTINPEQPYAANGGYIVYWHSRGVEPVTLVLPRKEVELIQSGSHPSVIISLGGEGDFGKKTVMYHGECQLTWQAFLPVCDRVVEYEVVLSDATRLAGLGPVIEAGVSDPEGNRRVRLTVDASVYATLQAKDIR